MPYRHLEIAWLPRSKIAWSAFTNARTAAANLWNAMVTRHARIRRLKWEWPSYGRWCRWARGRFVGMSAQSVQQLVKDFCDAISGAVAARRAQRASGSAVTAKFPWKTTAHRSVPYTNQDAVIRNGWLRLSNGLGCEPLRVKIPKTLRLPGRLMEVALAYGRVQLVCLTAEDDAAVDSAPLVGIDLGVNTIAAATDGNTAVVVSGREMKAIQQYRNKRLGSIRSKLSRTVKGSRRHKKLQQRKRAHLNHCANKQKDLCHKVTRVVASAFPGSPVVVGEAFHDSARKMMPRRAQQVSQACTGEITQKLSYKLHGATKIDESYSSQTCPVCGCRQRCLRVYRCKTCGLVAPRDVVGAVNIRAIGLHGALTPGQQMPTVVRFVRPLRKYPGPARAAPGSSGGTPASSSLAA